MCSQPHAECTAGCGVAPCSRPQAALPATWQNWTGSLAKHQQAPDPATKSSPTCAEKMQFITPMYCEGTSGAALKHSSLAGCSLSAAGGAPPPLPPSRLPWAAAARRCMLWMKHSTRLSVLLSWQALPLGAAATAPPCAAAASAAAPACCITRWRPLRMAVEGGQGSATTCPPAAATGDGWQLGEQKASWQPPAPAVNTASRLASLSSVKAFRKVSSCGVWEVTRGGGWASRRLRYAAEQ